MSSTFELRKRAIRICNDLLSNPMFRYHKEKLTELLNYARIPGFQDSIMLEIVGARQVEEGQWQKNYRHGKLCFMVHGTHIITYTKDHRTTWVPTTRKIRNTEVAEDLRKLEAYGFELVNAKF